MQQLNDLNASLLQACCLPGDGRAAWACMRCVALPSPHLASPQFHHMPPPPRLRIPQSLNPLPMVAMWANCVAWLVYAFLTKDPYVLCPNWAGLLLGTFMTMACFGLADDEVSRQRCVDPAAKHACASICNALACSTPLWLLRTGRC